MFAHVARLPFSLHPLMAEAKRRAQRRRVLLVILVIALAGGGAGAAYTAHPFGWLRSSATAGDYQPGYLITCAGCPSLGHDVPAVAVSASSRASAWVVGSDVAWRWSGGAWRSVPLPHASGTYLQSVTTTGPDDAWAVGSAETDQEVHNRALVEHWNGTRWSVVRLPSLPESMLSAVSASGPRNVWTAGVISTAKSDKQFWHKAQPLLLHWNGVAWRRQPLPWGRIGMGLEKVVATGTSSLWVVSQPTGVFPRSVLEQWNGSGWRAVPAPFGPDDPLLGFSATAGNDAWAVGSYAQHLNGAVRARPLAAHWDGAAWRFTPIPPRRGNNASVLADVVAVRPDDAWAIGQIQPVRPDEAIEPVFFFLHWDGRSWKAAPGSARSGFFSSPKVGAARDGTAWAVGNCGDDNVVLGWNGSSWKVTPHPGDLRWSPGVPARSRHGVNTCAATVSGG